MQPICISFITSIFAATASEPAATAGRSHNASEHVATARERTTTRTTGSEHEL
jgi:hypothetical protein